jgi:hypothetical protein
VDVRVDPLQPESLIGLTLLAVALALFLPAMPQPLAYHDFADKREAYGIENFLDVASNLAFMLAGWPGCCWCCARAPASRAGRTLPYAGVLHRRAADGAGSCYYHLEAEQRDAVLGPAADDDRVHVADRGADRRPRRRARRPAGAGADAARRRRRRSCTGSSPSASGAATWCPMRAAGLLGDRAAASSRRCTRRATRTATRSTRCFAGYVLAKGFEHFDREIFELTGVVSGHTLKHVAAGLAGPAGRLHAVAPCEQQHVFRTTTPPDRRQYSARCRASRHLHPPGCRHCASLQVR